jgi:hypothetical protein
MVANPRNDQPRSYQSWSGISATPNDFNLDAGRYGLTIAGGGFTSYQLQRLLPDGATYAPAMPVTAAAGYTVLDLPAGQYSLAVVATALSGVIEKIDTGRAR